MAKGVVIVELCINLEKRFHLNGYKNSSVYLTILRFLLNEFKFKIPNLSDITRREHLSFETLVQKTSLFPFLSLLFLLTFRVHVRSINWIQ